MTEPMYKCVNGETLLMTQEEVDALTASIPQGDFSPLPMATAQPIIIAMAELTVVDFDLTGIESSTCLGAAFFIDTGIIWVFFSQVQPNTQYLPFAQCPGFNADVTAREVDYFEIKVTDRATHQPAMPGSVSISVQRVV